MSQNPLDQPCSHIATAGEQLRDRDYLACGAAPGAPCCWAQRFDGLTDPDFHSERLEAAVRSAPAAPPLDPATLEAAVLNSGLV